MIKSENDMDRSLGRYCSFCTRQTSLDSLKICNCVPTSTPTTLRFPLSVLLSRHQPSNSASQPVSTVAASRAGYHDNTSSASSRLTGRAANNNGLQSFQFVSRGSQIMTGVIGPMLAAVGLRISKYRYIQVAWGYTGEVITRLIFMTRGHEWLRINV